MTELGAFSTRQFNPHRKGVSATDSAAPTDANAGTNGQGYEKMLVDLAVKSGTLTGCTLEVLTWSEASQSFVSQYPAASQAMTGPGQFAFDQLYGRRFWIMVSALTGSAPVLDISVQGFYSELEFD